MRTAIEKNSLKAWFMAARVKTLCVPFAAVMTTTFLIKYEKNTIYWGLGFITLLVSILITIATNFINDGIDFYKGKDTEHRLGFQRVSQSGLISAEIVYKMGVWIFVCAFIASIPLYLNGGFPLLIIIPLCILAGYAYTGGPYPLSYHGLGEVFVLVFYGWILTGGVYYVQTLSYTTSVFILGFQMGLLSTAIIAINNFRDIVEDTITGKKTLAVRFGPFFSRCEISFCLLMPYLLNGYWIDIHHLALFALPILTLPLTINLIFKIWNVEPSNRFNQFFGQAALIHLSFGILLGIGFIINS